MSEVRHRFVTVNDVRLHVAEQGEGEPVILLHGFPECWYSWRYQLPVLAENGYRAIAPDMRGYNLSDKPTQGYDVDTLADDVAALAHALCGRQALVHLAGHDWGGGVAWQVAWRYPGLLRSLTIMNAPHPALFARSARRSPRQMLRSSYMFFFQAPALPEWLLTRGDAGAVATAFRRSAYRRDAFSDEDLDVYRRAMLRPGAATATLSYYRQVLLSGRRRFPTGPIDTPTLVLWGMDDPVLPFSLNDGLGDWVKDVTIVPISACGHWTQQEQPGVVTREVLGWLSRASARP
jgi:pimeloyl-ACP methyl ester carboxylesterase